MPSLLDDNGTWVLKPDADLADLEGNVVDITDGTWSHIDVNNQVKSFSVFNGENKVVLNAVSSGTSTQFSNNAYQGARWYKPLTDSKGVRMNTTDNFLFIATIQALSSSNPAPFGFGIGTSVTPLATGSVGAAKQNFQHVSLPNELDGSLGRKHEYDRCLKLAGGSALSNHFTSSVVQMTINYNNGRVAGVCGANDHNTVSTAAGTTDTSTNPLFVQVGIGTRYNTVSALEDAEHKAKMSFLVIRLDSP
jgi:hypothetical protein